MQKTSYSQSLWTKIQLLDHKTQLSHILQTSSLQNIISQLQTERGRGRNDYSISDNWKILLTKLLSPSAPPVDYPPASAFSRFLSLIIKHQDLIENSTREQIKLFHSTQTERTSPLILKHFNNTKSNLIYHYLIESFSGLPIAVNLVHKTDCLISSAYFLIEEWKKIFPFHDEQILIADERYDNISFITTLWDNYRIKPIIPLTPASKLSYSNPSSKKNILLSSIGEIFCSSPSGEALNKLIYCGFEENRGTLKFKCIAKYYDISCKNQTKCDLYKGLRVPLQLDRRLITPIPRSSYKWECLYKKSISTDYFHPYILSLTDITGSYSLPKKKLFFSLLRYFLYTISLECSQET